MSRGIPKPPPEPFNPTGQKHGWWVWTNPTALTVLGSLIIALGAFFAVSAFLGKAGSPSSQVGMATAGLSFALIGGLMVYIGRRRARWHRELDAWEREHGPSGLR